jgi:hypothetical protein
MESGRHGIVNLTPVESTFLAPFSSEGSPIGVPRTSLTGPPRHPRQEDPTPA